MSEQPSSRPFGGHAWILVIVVVAILAYGLGARSGSAQRIVNGQASAAQNGGVTGIGSSSPKNVAENVDFQEFWELWQVLQTKYYQQPIDEQKMLYGAMQGLASSLGDPYTVFFEPEIAKEFSDSLEGKFEGIGAEIGIKEDQLQIVAPLPESPAEKAGLLSGDAILMINGTSTESMSVEEAVSMIRGDKGTEVTLSIGRVKTSKDENGRETRDANTFDVKIIRDTIVVNSVRVSYPEAGIAMIQISSFNLDTTEEFAKAADEVAGKNVKGLIVDLRNNPGGFLDRATAVAGEWVGDQVVVSERRQGVTVDEFRGTGKGRLKDMPTVVLVNGGSASASEIVAGALQDYGKARLVGEKTYGKGSVQDYSELDAGTAVKVTVAEWLTPKGRSINGIGIPPDIEVERTEEDYVAERDPQLKKAIELLGGSTASTTAASTTTP